MASGKAQSNLISDLTPAIALESKSNPTNEDKSFPITVSAYYKAEIQGFSPEYALKDWLTADSEEL
jgi:hypothetical protein